MTSQYRQRRGYPAMPRSTKRQRRRKSFLDLADLPAVGEDFLVERPEMMPVEGRVKFCDPAEGWDENAPEAD